MNKDVRIEKLLVSIIPPDDYLHRNGFSNAHIIDKLDERQRVLIEDVLLNELSNKHDMLIVETLAYMKSSKSVPILTDLLEKCSDAMCQIIVASSIFEINHDNKMISISSNAFENLDSVYQKISAFYYLKKINSKITDGIIEEYTTHSDYLLSYNAKRVLGK